MSKIPQIDPTTPAVEARLSSHWQPLRPLLPEGSLYQQWSAMEKIRASSEQLSQAILQELYHSMALRFMTLAEDRGMQPSRALFVSWVLFDRNQVPALLVEVLADRLEQDLQDPTWRPEINRTLQAWLQRVTPTSDYYTPPTLPML